MNISLFSQIRMIAQDEFKMSIKTKKALLCLALYLSFFILTGLIWNKLYSEVVTHAGQFDIQERDIQEISNMISTDIQNRYEFVKHILNIPPVALITFLISLLLAPSIALLMSYDSISAEYSNQSIRYLLIRCRRTGFYLGKLIGQCILIYFIIILGFFIMYVFTFFKYSLTQFLPTFMKCMQYSLYTCIYATTQVSFIVLLSSLCKKPMISLLWCVFAPFLLHIFAWKYLPFIIPFKYIDGFMHYETSALINSILAFTLFTIFNSALGCFLFTRRNI